MIISCIDKSEESDVAVMDIPGSLLIADIDEIVHMMLRGDRIQGQSMEQDLCMTGLD